MEKNKNSLGWNSSRSLFELEPLLVDELVLQGGLMEESLQSILVTWARRKLIQAGGFFILVDDQWTQLAQLPWGAECNPLGHELPVKATQKLLKEKPGHGHEAGLFIRANESLWSCPFMEDNKVIGRLVISQGANQLDSVPHLSPYLYTIFTLLLRQLSKSSNNFNTLPGVFCRQSFNNKLPISDRGLIDLEDFPHIVGKSEKLLQTLGIVRMAAPTDSSILIHGKSGTGKELIARSIHQLSKRKAKRFESENCAVFSASLLEAELFGSEQGAYTGADRKRIGLIERACGGTLFLDEIAEMDITLQTKLLRVLQERVLRRVGGEEKLDLDFRLISATHKDLDKEIEEGNFRQDLKYRIEVIRIELPSLQERKDDIPILVESFIDEIARQRSCAIPKLCPRALEELQNYSWPGNIRELRNEIERSMTLSPKELNRKSLSNKVLQKNSQSNLSKNLCAEIGTDLKTVERSSIGGFIAHILFENGGNKSATARALGIPKTNLYRYINKYGISV